MTVSAQLDPDRDLDIAMATAADVNRVIVAADGKTGLVLAAQGVVLAGVASSLSAGPQPSWLVRAGAIVILALAVLVVLLLMAALWPRTNTPEPGWFGFMTFRSEEPGAIPPRPDAAVLAAQAWRRTVVLADIIRRKLRWFRVALLVASIELVGFAGWILLATSGAE